MRGKHALINIAKEIGQATLSAQPSQPAQTNYERKVAAIMARYYYHMQNGMLTDKILPQLEFEFYLTTGHIAKIISDNVDQLKELRKKAPKKEWFRSCMAHFVW